MVRELGYTYKYDDILFYCNYFTRYKNIEPLISMLATR